MWFEALVSLGGQWFPASVIQFFERERILHYYCIITYSPLAAHHEIVSLNIILDEKRVFLARNIFKQISEHTTNTDIVHTIKRSLDELTGNKCYGVVLFDSQTQMLKDISTYSDYDDMESELMETQHSTFNLQDDLESELVETHHMVSEIKTIETKLLVSHQQTQSVAGLDDVNFSELNLHAEPSEGSFVITNFENVDIESIKKTEIEPKKGKHRPTLSFQATVEGFNLEPSVSSSLKIENIPTNTTSTTTAQNEKQQKQKPKSKSKKQRHGEPGVVYDQLYSSIENGLMGLRFPKKIVDIIMQNYLEFQYFQTEKRLNVRDKNNPTLKLSTSGQVIYSSRIATSEATIKRSGRGTWKIVSSGAHWNVQVDVVLETEKKKPKIQPQNENLPKGVKKTHKSFMKAINKPITMTFPLRDYLNA